MSTLVDQNNLYGMKENIYIKALEIGFENETTGISFNEIVEKAALQKA